MRRVFLLLILVSGLILPVLLQGQAQQAPPQDETPVLAVPKDYRYNSKGRRDPFVNPIPKPKADTTPSVVVPPPAARPPGLRGVLVGEATITGVVTSKEPSMNVVIISAPGAKTAYFARVGDQLYDARIKGISLDNVTFTVTGPPGGEVRTPRDVVRRVRPTP
jgi:hypothetical protein